MGLALIFDDQGHSLDIADMIVGILPGGWSQRQSTSSMREVREERAWKSRLNGW